MALDTLRCNHLAPLGFKGLIDECANRCNLHLTLFVAVSLSSRHPGGVVMYSIAFVCQSVSVCPVWAVAQKLNFWHAGIYSEHLGHFRISRSWGQGQRRLQEQSKHVCVLLRFAIC